MNKNIIIAVSAIAGGVAAYFLLRKLWTKEEEQAPARSHHLTDVFSKAKEYATHN